MFASPKLYFVPQIMYFPCFIVISYASVYRVSLGITLELHRKPRDSPCVCETALQIWLIYCMRSLGTFKRLHARQYKSYEAYCALAYDICLKMIYSALCYIIDTRDNFVYAPDQWENTLHCNVVSHWLVAYTKWFQYCVRYFHTSWYDQYLAPTRKIWLKGFRIVVRAFWRYACIQGCRTACVKHI